MPAEWELQEALLLAWPWPTGDFSDVWPSPLRSYDALIEAVLGHQPVHVIVKDEPTAAELRARWPHRNFSAHVLPLDDIWVRDSAPIPAYDRARRLVNFDFAFTGWGEKYAAENDAALCERLAALGVVSSVRKSSFVLEGGSLDSDGAGSALLTERCLLNENRGPRTRSDIEGVLAEELGIDRCLWLTHGYLAGDDTDAHIDTLARFIDAETIAYVRCDDPSDEHYTELQAMEAELSSLRTRDGRPYRLISLPWAAAVRHPVNGMRLPATYANFLFVNDALCVPTYDLPTDERALAILGAACPERRIYPIPARALITQYGSVHCASMGLFPNQEPRHES